MCSYEIEVEIWPNISKPHLIILWLVRICLQTISTFFLQIKSLFKSLASIFKQLSLFILCIQMIYK
jgi:hypothetical protein